MILSDGSKVWLNAESSLYYPVYFTGSQRKVELRGEGYFEIEKNGSKPFVVSIRTEDGLINEVKVLGTKFNVNAYEDERNITTTLVEGSVEVIHRGRTKALKAGEQAVISQNIKIRKVDTAEFLAWKEGKFLFRNASIRSIGEQIKRWYNVELVYEGNLTDHFNGEFERTIPLERLLFLLEGTERVHFSLDGNRLTVKP